mmetsp:Transcript_29966/g.86206  ORF Transcript_29966/g.86206 Transcript_29966/m.86206 type:complete len:137 (-) Transcript_29966:106-516(-)
MFAIVVLFAAFAGVAANPKVFGKPGMVQGAPAASMGVRLDGIAAISELDESLLLGEEGDDLDDETATPLAEAGGEVDIEDDLALLKRLMVLERMAAEHDTVLAKLSRAVRRLASIVDREEALQQQQSCAAGGGCAK